MNHMDVHPFCSITSVLTDLWHLSASPLQVSPKQWRSPVSKVSNFFFHFIAQYDKFTAVNNQGSGQSYWPPPLSNFTTVTLTALLSSSPPPNHVISTILDLKAQSHSTEQLSDRIPCPSPSPHYEALCPSLSLFSQVCGLFLHLFVPSNVKSSCHASPFTLTFLFWAPSQRGRRHGWGHENRPKWLSFTCTTHCSVPVLTIFNPPAHSTGPTIDPVPI